MYDVPIGKMTNAFGWSGNAAPVFTSNCPASPPESCMLTVRMPFVAVTTAATATEADSAAAKATHSASATRRMEPPRVESERDSSRDERRRYARPLVGHKRASGKRAPAAPGAAFHATTRLAQARDDAVELVERPV